MEAPFNLCIIKPNKDAFSETFIQEHINKLPGNKKVLYGGVFPVYDADGEYLIKSKIGILSYLIQKRIFKKTNIKVRTKALVKYLIKENIQIVLAEFGMVGAMVTEACQTAQVPLVIYYFGADVYHKQTVETYSAFYQKAFKYASALVVVSKDMIDGLLALGAQQHKIWMIPCGADTSAYPVLDISCSGENFLAVGRFVEKKNPTLLVKAFKLVADKRPNARLTMVGTGPLFNETKALIAELGLNDKITLTGVLTPAEIRELMKQSRCFVQHSVTAADGDKEGTPVIILEAGSSGLPIVSTEHAGIKESVIHGETGFLVPEHDIEGMAYYMVKIAGDVNLAVNLGLKEAAHIRKNFDIKHTINSLTQVLHQSLKRT